MYPASQPVGPDPRDRGPWCRPTRVNSPTGERPKEVPSHEDSLENTISPKSPILWGFPRVLEAAKADSNHTRTVWRWMQSVANRSLRLFPYIRENTGNFLNS